MTKRTNRPPTREELRAKQSSLRIVVATRRQQLHEAQCELIQVSQQLGEVEEFNPAGSSNDGGFA